MDGRPILWTFVFVLAVNKPCLSSESDIYAFTARDIRGNDVPLSIYKGKVGGQIFFCNLFIVCIDNPRVNVAQETD